MTTLILLTAFAAGWSYEGFISDPVKEVAITPARPSRPDNGSVPPPTGPVNPPPHSSAEGSRQIDSPGRRGPTERAVSMPPPPASPTLWRLADATGQVWEHTDSDWLRRWVESRNATLRTAVPPAAPIYFGTANCANGRCVRGR